MKSLPHFCCVLLIFAFYISSAEGFDWSCEPVKDSNGWQVRVQVDGQTAICSSEKGLWSIALGWQEGAPTNWVDVPATKKEVRGNVTVLTGRVSLGNGELFLRDCYQLDTPTGMLKCVRRYEYRGKTVEKITLKTSWEVPGKNLQAFLPGILYYGNPSGNRNTPGFVPAYSGKTGEFAIFEEHRFPMPFACLEDAENLRAAAIHVVPSPAYRGSVADQWNSMGVRAVEDSSSSLELYSGYVGFNGKNGVVKARQSGPMDYPEATITLVNNTVIEKIFYLDAWSINAPGEGFRQPVAKSIALNQPFSSAGLPSREEILRSKIDFARSRWLEVPEGDGSEVSGGFRMHPDGGNNYVVMGWCGQAEVCGYAFQVLEDKINRCYASEPAQTQDQVRNWIPRAVQKSLDLLSTTPQNPNGFSVIYDMDTHRWLHNGDPVSCGQAMYHFAKAIEFNRKTNNYDSKKWEAFLTQACDNQSKRILDERWYPRSTAEGFYIAPLSIASKLFNNPEYLRAARKAADHYIERHLSMKEPYWGGTLDANGEDKEGAWAAFQGFFVLYETTGEKKYLDAAVHAGDCCMSYTVVWDIPMPPGRLADHAFKSRGWTVVSPQNQHLDLYAVTMTPEFYRLGIATQNKDYAALSQVMFRSCGQLTDSFGSQGEQIQQTNFGQYGDLSDVLSFRGGYSEGWTVFWLTAHFLSAEARFTELGI